MVADVKKSKYYTVIADEATDYSLQEQIALIFRFVYESNTIREEFVSFLECSYGLSGQSSFKTIMEFLHNNGIDISILGVRVVMVQDQLQERTKVWRLIFSE